MCCLLKEITVIEVLPRDMFVRLLESQYNCVVVLLMCNVLHCCYVEVALLLC